MTSKLATHMNEINTAVQVVLSQLSTCFFVECVTNVKGPFFFYQSASYYEQWGPTRTQHFFYIWTIFVISHKRFLVCLAAFESNCDESFVVVYLATSVSQIWSNQNPHSLIITLIATQFQGGKNKNVNRNKSILQHNPLLLCHPALFPPKHGWTQYPFAANMVSCLHLSCPTPSSYWLLFWYLLWIQANHSCRPLQKSELQTFQRTLDGEDFNIQNLVFSWQYSIKNGDTLKPNTGNCTVTFSQVSGWNSNATLQFCPVMCLWKLYSVTLSKAQTQKSYSHRILRPLLTHVNVWRTAFIHFTCVCVLQTVDPISTF